MINKFKEDGLTWYVDEEKGVFICKCPEASELLEKEYLEFAEDEYFNICFFNAAAKWHDTYGNQMNCLFGKAKANTAAGEIIDIERGKKLAKARLVEKLSAYRASFYSAVLAEATQFVYTLHKRIEGNKRITLNSAVKISELSNMGKEN